jgi:hypothetical protein
MEINDPKVRIALWQNNQSAEENKPSLKGVVEIGDNKYRVALWRNGNKKYGAPTFTGCIEFEEFDIDTHAAQQETDNDIPY